MMRVISTRQNVINDFRKQLESGEVGYNRMAIRK